MLKKGSLVNPIRVINDLIEHINREGEEGILFSIEIEKTFDSVDHNFLFATLKKMWFWNRICELF